MPSPLPLSRLIFKLRSGNSKVAIGTLEASPDGIKLTSNKNPSVAFINWAVNDDQFLSCDLLDGTDFSICKLVFFDPHSFAMSNSFISPDSEISKASYLSLDEPKFLRYLSKIRKALKLIKKLLANGGILVIRSNVPKVHIKVRKRRATGTTHYIKSVVSLFFWLEDILGTYSFTYCQASTIKYLKPKNSFKQIMGNPSVDCVQTLNSVNKGKMEIIASIGKSQQTASISRITFEEHTGQVFLIPRFAVNQEYKKLIETFENISYSRNTGSVRPKWIEYYENQVRDYSPCRDRIKKVETQKEALQKQLAVLFTEQEKYEGLVDMLFENDEELQLAVYTALEILGFECKKGPKGKVLPTFKAYPSGDKTKQILVRTTSTENNSILETEITELKKAVDRSLCSSKPKGILIGNANRSVRPEQREQWFHDSILEENKKHEFCLLPSLVLFTMTCYIMTREDKDNIEELKISLRNDIINCETIFILNRNKYAI